MKKKLGNEEFGYFGAYYPELDILSIEEYGFFDLGNSKIEQAENPDYSILSPDKQWLINTQHYKNGCPFLKKRNNTTGKYEFIGDFHDIIHYNNNWESWFCSTQKWFWISNNKVFFTTGSGGKSYDGQPYEAEYSYEIEIVQTESAEKNDDCP